MIEDTFATYQAKLAELQRTMSGSDLTRMSHTVAVQAQGDAADAVQSTLHGPGFSGWRPGKVIALTTKVTDTGIGRSVLLPAGASAGPWTVAESGRHPMHGPKITSGGKSGIRKISRARVKRYNGETQGKGTTTRAHRTIAERTPARMQALYAERLIRIFGR